MPAYVRTPEIPGVPVRQVNVATYRKRVKTGMPYVWKSWENSAALYDRQGEVIAGVKREDCERFFMGLLLRDDALPLELGATGGVVVRARVPASHSAQAETGTQLQNRLRSPWTLSTRPTDGQYLPRLSEATGNTAISRA